MRRQTSDIRRQTHISSFRAKREIFVIRGLAVNDWKFQTLILKVSAGLAVKIALTCRTTFC